MKRKRSSWEGNAVEGSSSGAAASSASNSKLARLIESLVLEHHFLRVPFECYKNTLRQTVWRVKICLPVIVDGVTRLADSDISRDDAVKQLRSSVKKLVALKKHLKKDRTDEQLQVQRYEARLEHLMSAKADNLSEWISVRLKRMLVDYMMRMSYYDTAVLISRRSNIQDLVDVDKLDIFRKARLVIDALQLKDVGVALAWCAENEFGLKRLQAQKRVHDCDSVPSFHFHFVIEESDFEFQLRQQQVIEMVRAEKYTEAISYVQDNMKPWLSTHINEISRIMTTLAFKSNARSAEYEYLFEEKQWSILLSKFKQDFSKLHGMTAEPLLNIYLQAGLSALKMPSCYRDDCPKEDPLSQDGFRKLAEELPYSTHQETRLICYVTKELMGADNLPLVLPNGFVYSTQALEYMKNPDYKNLRCPRTGELCSFLDMKKMYIVKTVRS